LASGVTRYLIYTVRRRGLEPVGAADVARALRAELGGAPVSVRVASGHVEVSASGVDLESLVRAAEKVVGPVIEVESPPGRGVLADYAWLMDKERFWEAHELLEEAWKSSGRDPAIQALILAAAVMAKAQEGRLSGIERNIKVLNDVQRESGLDVVDVDCLRSEALKALRGERPSPLACIRVSGVERVGPRAE